MSSQNDCAERQKLYITLSLTQHLLYKLGHVLCPELVDARAVAEQASRIRFNSCQLLLPLLHFIFGIAELLVSVVPVVLELLTKAYIEEEVCLPVWNA